MRKKPTRAEQATALLTVNDVPMVTDGGTVGTNVKRWALYVRRYKLGGGVCTTIIELAGVQWECVAAVPDAPPLDEYTREQVIHDLVSRQTTRKLGRLITELTN